MSRPIDERGWIGVDLDATLAEYHGWPADGGIGNPIPAMLSRVKQWVDRMLYHDDMAVRIFTARVCPGGRVNPVECEEQREKIQAWCKEHIGVVLPVVYEKDFRMVTLYDDRCETVEANTGETLREKLSAAERERDALAGRVDRLETALRAVLVMWDRGPCPSKLDEALSWRENDELARSMANAALEGKEPR